MDTDSGTNTPSAKAPCKWGEQRACKGSPLIHGLFSCSELRYCARVSREAKLRPSVLTSFKLWTTNRASVYTDRMYSVCLYSDRPDLLSHVIGAHTADSHRCRANSKIKYFFKKHFIRVKRVCRSVLLDFRNFKQKGRTSKKGRLGQDESGYYIWQEATLQSPSESPARPGVKKQ